MNKRIHFSVLVVLLFFFACSEEKQTPNKHIPEEKASVSLFRLEPMPYYNLLSELDLNDDMLQRLNIKQCTASYFLHDTDKQAFKTTYQKFKPTQGDIDFFLVQQRNKLADTVVKQTMVSAENNIFKYLRVVHAANGKTNQFEISKTYSSEQLLEQKVQRNLSNQRTETENYSYNNKQLVKKSLEGLGEELYNYAEDGKLATYVLRKIQGDTIRSSSYTYANQNITVQFSKGGRDRFEYLYDQGRLKQVNWTENGKLLVQFLFQYDGNGLLSARITKSSIPAFPSNITRYTFN